MGHLTPEQIVNIAESESTVRKTQITIINRYFRLQDESFQWPVSGRFNVTERAIKAARKHMGDTTEQDVLAYALAVDAEMSRIVNGII